MALQRGFAAIREAKKESDANRAAFEAQRTRDLLLMKDGDEAVVWFIGTSDTEPFMVKVHSLRGVGKMKYREDICAAGFKGHAGCVECWAVNHGDKRVGKARKKGVFSFVDTRFVHKALNETKTAETGGKYERFDWAECTSDDDDPDPSSCKACKRKIPRERRGLCRGKYGIQNLTAIEGINNQLARKCLNCGGKVRSAGFVNKKGKRLDDLEDVENPEAWTQEFTCKGCDDPSPGNVFACPITIRRNGTGESTSYTFTPGPFESPPDWVLEIEPLDMEKMLLPRSADKQAELLGVQNPFSEWTGGKSNGKGEAADYNETDEDPFDNAVG